MSDAHDDGGALCPLEIAAEVIARLAPRCTDDLAADIAAELDRLGLLATRLPVGAKGAGEVDAWPYGPPISHRITDALVLTSVQPARRVCGHCLANDVDTIEIGLGSARGFDLCAPRVSGRTHCYRLVVDFGHEASPQGCRACQVVAVMGSGASE
jgi:hypothetical protein